MEVSCCQFLIVVNLVHGYSISGGLNGKHIRSNSLYSKLAQMTRALGHLSAVYCVAFDRTGQFIITVRYSLWRKYVNSICLHVTSTLKFNTMSMMTVTLTGRMGQEPIMMLSKCPSSFIMYIGFDGGRDFTCKQDLKLIFGVGTRVLTVKKTCSLEAPTIFRVLMITW